MSANRISPPRAGARRAQQGISLIFALMALVILGLGAVALTRSIDSGTLVMGNLSFKQDALVASGSGAEEAMQWLQTNNTGTNLNEDVPDRGYYASSIDRLDPAGTRTSTSNPLPVVNWDANCLGLDAGTYSSCTVRPYRGVDVNANRVQWVITRLCDGPGAPSGANLCARPSAGGGGGPKDRGELQPGGRLTGTVASPYFRIIVRVEGPRNTVSYTESLVHF
jgi:Tfp pilus assembly protein PilX